LIAIGTFGNNFSLEGSSGNTFELVNQYIPFNMWVAKFDSEGNAIWLISPQSNFNPLGINLNIDSFFNAVQIIPGNFDEASTSFYISSTFNGDFTLGTHNIISKNGIPEISLSKLIDAPMDNNPNWDWVRTIEAPVPDIIYLYPHIAYINGEIYINFYGLNSIIFNNMDNPSGGVDVINLNGTLINVFNLISTFGVWGLVPTYIPGTIDNPSINIAAGPNEDVSNPIYLIGSHTIGTYLTGAFLRRY